MAEESQSPADAVFYPPRLWGLDFHFNTFNKLYIADILSLKPYPSYPGAFAYGNHPVYKVDVMGIVVRKDDKPKLFLYSDNLQMSDCRMSELSPDLQSELLALRAERETDTAAYELGDLIHVRGKLKMFRDLIEIVAFYHCRIDNPGRQVSRMLELPHLYRQCYDKPFIPPYKIQKELLHVSKTNKVSTQSFQDMKQRLKENIQQVLKTLKVVEFSLSDLMEEHTIADLAAKMDKDGGGMGALREVLKEMEEVEGTVCFRHHAVSASYENLSRTSPLEGHVMTMLQTLSSNTKYREKGCHLQLIQGQVQRSVQYSSLHSSALLFVLQRLETNSDIVRVTDRCYLPPVTWGLMLYVSG